MRLFKNAVQAPVIFPTIVFLFLTVCSPHLRKGMLFFTGPVGALLSDECSSLLRQCLLKITRL